MSVKLFVDGTEVPIVNDNFPAGETSIKINPFHIENQMNISIHWLYQNDAELMQVLMLVRAIRQVTPGKHLTLYVPYVPHSRMDRVIEKGVPFSLVDVINIINLCEFNGIYTEDNHSDAIETLLTDNVSAFYNQPQYEGMKELHYKDELNISVGDIFVSPDAGASKKIYECAKAFSVTRVVNANKVREVTTGNIVSTHVPKFECANDQSIWVIDDICDGGRTFIELAKAIRKQHTTPKLKLYVTHGIFSKGIKLLEGYYDEVHCLHNMSEY